LIGEGNVDVDIDDLIRYENENSTLDFKAKQYTKEQFGSLLKDVMAMANSDTTSDKFIIVGIKQKSNGEKAYLGIERSEFVDSAVYQQLILENIEPDIPLDYFPHEFEEKVLGVLKISDCLNRPYMMKKDHGNLKKGDCLIRKGSQQSPMSRSDLDRIFESKKSSEDYDKVVQIAFSGSNGMQDIELPAVRRFVRPSERANEEILKVIEQKKRELELKSASNVVNHFDFRAGLTSAYAFLGGTPYESRSIEELEKNLAVVKETYLSDDYYEVFEKHSHKINITIINNGLSYLEDCSIEVIIKKISGLLIATRIYKKPENNNYMFLPKPSLVNHVGIMYPSVDSTDDTWIIKETIGDIRHHIPIDAFKIDLRIVPTQKITTDVIELECRLFGKNLSYPLIRTLKIKVTEPEEAKQEKENIYKE